MDSFDYIVVGAGSAGCAVAARLAKAGHKVCLIEAGGENRLLSISTPGMLALNVRGGSSNWSFETVPQPGLLGRKGFQPRGKGLGGSSAINAMLYVRGNAWDYDNWQALGCNGWSYADVLPWFRHSEANERGSDQFHGGHGPLSVSDQHWTNPASKAFLDGAESHQLGCTEDFNGTSQDGFGFYQVTQKNGERWSAAQAFLTPHPNLAIRTKLLVERILIEDGKATGVVLSQNGQRTELRASAGVVLSAGAFGSPQLLMLSGIGPANHLQAMDIPVQLDRQAVGEDLQDHIDYVGSWRSASHEPIGFTPGGAWKLVRALIEHRRTRSGMMTSPMAEAGGFWRSAPSLSAPDVQFHFVPALLEDHGHTFVWGYGISCHACVLRPESRGTVRLVSPDPNAAPLIDPQFLSDPRDIVVLRAGVRLMHRIIAAPAFAGYGLKDRFLVDIDDDATLDHLIRSRADTVYHPVGTCRMGGDPESVVDPRLKLRGVDHLWVADASVMPRIVSGNTNATSIMIGERCGDFIAEAIKA